MSMALTEIWYWIAYYDVTESWKWCFRWSQGLIFHQAVVDCARAAILLPMGRSIFLCEAISKCALVETTFLLLVTVSTVNLLTTVLNDAPILPDEDSEDTLSLLKDSPQCVSFGLFMIWFSSITINLGPTFLSGALAANADAHMLQPSCPLVQVRPRSPPPPSQSYY